MLVWEYNNKITNATEYISIKLYFPGVLKDRAIYLAKVLIEIHLTDDLKANILINTDVLTPNNFVIDYASQSATIDSCQNIQI